MAGDKKNSGESFDLERVRELIEMMAENGVTEVNLRKGEEQWRLRRGPQEVVTMAAPMPTAHAPAVAPPPPVAQSATPAAPSSPAAAPSDGTVEIKSPTIGTFYSAPSPDDPAFVSVGSKVTPESVVCLVEAMKVFNQVQADTTGTITEILVSDGDSVEFNQPLFRVKP